jgi:hypothetical protein
MADLRHNAQYAMQGEKRGMRNPYDPQYSQAARRKPSMLSRQVRVSLLPPRSQVENLWAHEWSWLKSFRIT